MEAVLYVAHGSRVKAGVEEAKQFINGIKPTIDIGIQEICFLELAEPSIIDGVAACVQRGATSIAVIPILLLTANHAKEGIPLELNKAKELYPHVSFTVGKPFGVHEKLITSLHSRIQDKTAQHPDEIDILLVGRGSSDPGVQIEFQQIADRLKRYYQYNDVNICFLYGEALPFDQALLELKSHNRNKTVYIVPYILFTGLLKQGIQKKIDQQMFTNEQVVLCQCLGYDENVSQVLTERVEETLDLLKRSVSYG